MNRKSTIFLKMTVIIIGILVLALCIYGMIWLTYHPVNSNYIDKLYPILLGMYVSAIPFFIALYQAFKLLNIIDMHQAFSHMSVKVLVNIKHCALVFSVLFVLIMPFIYLLAEIDDAPGLIIIGMIPIFASVVIAVFVAVLAKLLGEAIIIKNENDLTI